MQVQQRSPVLVDGDLARPVRPWQPPGEHLGYRPPGARAAHRRAPRRPRRPRRARRAGCSGRRPRPWRPHPAAGPAPGSSRPARSRSRSRSARQARRRPSMRGGSADRHCWCAMPPRPRPGRRPRRPRPAGRAAPIRATGPGSRAARRAGPPPYDQAVRVWWSGTWHMDPRIGSVSSHGEGAHAQPAGGAATTTPFVLAPFPPGGTGWRNKGQRSGQRPRNSWRADTVHPAVPGCRGTVGGSRGGRA